jgi:ActR/RegA family two-component response regulator
MNIQATPVAESGDGLSCMESLEMRDRCLLVAGIGGSAATEAESVLRAEIGGQVEVVRKETLLDGLRALQESTFHLIVCDLFLKDAQGLATLHYVRQQAPSIPVIALCHAAERETGMKAVRGGAYDFFCYEDLEPAALRKSVEGALKHSRSHSEHESAEERRMSARFPCRFAVVYQSLEEPHVSGEGLSETLNISSKGLLFTTDQKLEPGQLLQVSIDWPARLENQIPLKLVAEGRVVRADNGQTAMTIDKYEFRTRRAQMPKRAAEKRH